jgi:hypothetical protein
VELQTLAVVVGLAIAILKAIPLAHQAAPAL